LSLGALALNDIWFGGQTVNPWLLEEGASGSSAGPGAATAAGLVAFSIGSETGGSLKELKVQVPDAWPNLFRQARFLSAVDFVQADRFRRSVAQEMTRIFSQVDLLFVPSLRDKILTITNFTGHPSLTLLAGFVEVSEARSDWAPDPAHRLPKFSPPRRVPHGVTLIGRLFDEGTIGGAGLAMEQAFNVRTERPPGF
jgi:Asp-tRNA(Asn)/Glu-tRNA(Gln) amidotransferase A subunit family amidase